MVEINEVVKTYMRTGGGSSYAAEVVESEKGKTYIKYDAIRIGNSGDGSGGVAMQFLWKGAAVAWTRLYGAKLEGIRMHTTQPMYGRVEIDT